MKHLCFSVLCLTAPAVWAAPAAELPAAVVQAFEAYTALPGQIAPLLEKVKDATSAKATTEELKTALSSVYRTRELLYQMPDLTPSQNQQVRTRYGQRMRVEWARMYEQIARLKAARCYQNAEFAEAFHLMCMMIER